MNIKQNMFDLACGESRRKSAWRVVQAESFPCLGRGNRSAERPRKAFTLIELLVVVAIIGILISLLLPVIGSVKESARRGAAKADMQLIETAVDQYYAEYRRMPISDDLHQKDESEFWDTESPVAEMEDELRDATTNAFATLQGSNKDLNPREEQFLEQQAGRPFGYFLDPWSNGLEIDAGSENRLYRLLLDHNLDEVISIENLTGEEGEEDAQIEGKRAVVHSCGSNREINEVDDDDFDDLYNLDVVKILRHD